MNYKSIKLVKNAFSIKDLLMLILIILLIIPLFSLSINNYSNIKNRNINIENNSISMFNETQKVEIIYGLEGFLDYGGSNNFNNKTNAWYKNDSAYVELNEIYGDTISYWTFDFDQIYINLTRIFINIYGLTSSSDDIRLDIYNNSDDSWITISQVDFSTSDYSWENFTYIDFNEDMLIDGNRLLIRFYEMTLWGSDWWEIDYIDCTIEGYADMEAPIISDLSVYPIGIKYPNTTITINCTTYDVDSDIQSVIYYFNGNIGLTENLTITQLVTHNISNIYTHKIRLPIGNWTVTAIVSDTFNNNANKTISFQIEDIPKPAPNIYPNIFFIVNDTKIPVGETAQFTIYIQNGSHNLSNVWIFDGILDQNITLESNINEKTNLQYLYNTSGTTLGFYDFIFYVNDSNNNFTFFNWSNTFEIILPNYRPEFKNIIINNSYLGINHNSQINFSIKSDNWNLDDVWIYNPITDTNDTIAQNVNDKDWHNYTYITTNNITGSFIFKIYANNSFLTYSNQKMEITIITWHIIRNKNLPDFTYLAINNSNLAINNTAKITYNITSNEYALDKTWLYDPILNQNITIANINSEGVFQYTYNTKSSTSGKYNFIIYINDSYNNIISIKTEITWYIDTTAPILVVYPSNTILHYTDQLTFYISVTSTINPIDDIYIIYNNKTEVVAENLNFEGTYNCTYTLNGTRQPQDISFDIKTNDSNGNTKSQSIPVSFQMLILPPQVLNWILILLVVITILGLGTGTVIYAIRRFFLKDQEAEIVISEEISYQFKKYTILYYITTTALAIGFMIFLFFAIYPQLPFYITYVFPPIIFVIFFGLLFLCAANTLNYWYWIFGIGAIAVIVTLFYSFVLSMGILITILVAVGIYILLKYITKLRVNQERYAFDLRK